MHITIVIVLITDQDSRKFVAVVKWSWYINKISKRWHHENEYKWGRLLLPESILLILEYASCNVISEIGDRITSPHDRQSNQNNLKRVSNRSHLHINMPTSKILLTPCDSSLKKLRDKTLQSYTCIARWYTNNSIIWGEKVWDNCSMLLSFKFMLRRLGSVIHWT